MRGAIYIVFGLACACSAADRPSAASTNTHFDLRIPLTAGAAREASKAAQRVSVLRAIIDLPPGFDQRKRWPILLIFAPSGASAIAALPAYTNIALSTGWVVAAVDGPKVAAAQDDSTFAWEMVSSLLIYLRSAWPQSQQWPFACAGFSGGAKRAAMIAAQMQRRNDLMIGVFMGGCNEDRATLGYAIARPGPAFFSVPMFLSNGTRDRIAGVTEGEKVRTSMVQGGFREVRLETYNGEHRLDTNGLRLALEWFRSKAK